MCSYSTIVNFVTATLVGLRVYSVDAVISLLLASGISLTRILVHPKIAEITAYRCTNF